MDVMWVAFALLLGLVAAVEKDTVPVQCIADTSPILKENQGCRMSDNEKEELKEEDELKCEEPVTPPACPEGQVPDCSIYTCEKYNHLNTPAKRMWYLRNLEPDQNIRGEDVTSIKEDEIGCKCNRVAKHLTPELVCCMSRLFYANRVAEGAQCGTVQLDEGSVGCLLKDVYSDKTITQAPNIDLKVKAYLGIPFANPPLGDLAFSLPQPVSPNNYWGHTPSAHFAAPVGYFRGPACIQSGTIPLSGLPCDEKGPLGFLCELYGIVADCARTRSLATTQGKYDCLHLNVFAPEHATPQSNLPVFVFVHGGSYTSGTAMVPSYGGDKLASRGNMIMVVMNYRLGAVGFLADEKMGLEGNYGFWDQVEALKWIQKNIAKFGGDPTRVTVMGESAGATSVALLLAVPEASSLFHQAILESAPHSLPFHNSSLPPITLKLFWEDLGCTQDDAVERISCLRSSCPSSVMKAMKAGNTGMLDSPIQENLMKFLKKASPYLTSYAYNFGPVIGTNMIQEQIFDIMRKGRFNKQIPTIQGFNKHEGVMFALLYWMANRQIHDSITKRAWLNEFYKEVMYTVMPTAIVMSACFGSDLSPITTNYPLSYFGFDAEHNFWLMEEVFTDLIFKCSMVHQLTGFTQATSWVYTFEGYFPFEVPWRDACAMRSCHASELPYVLGHVSEPYVYDYTLNMTKEIAKKVHETRTKRVEMSFNGDGINRPPSDWYDTLQPTDMIKLQEDMMSYWINFVHTGDPNGLRLDSNDQLLQWDAWTSVPDPINSNDNPILVLGHPVSTTKRLESGFFNKCHVWEEIGFFW